jgi:hypothetical protein
MVLEECADPKQYLGDMSDMSGNLYVKCVDQAVIIFGKGVFREYLDALHWSIRAMFGDADAPTMGLDGLAIFLALWGLFITSYLIGEVGNAVSNGDPAGTEYRATCDNIRSMARRNNFPPDLRDRLHKFLLHSDAMFHSVFERKMLMGLSPAARKPTAGSRPHFKPLSLGHIDVDVADFWTNRWLPSSPRGTAEEVASKHSRTLKSS